MSEATDRAALQQAAIEAMEAMHSLDDGAKQFILGYMAGVTATCEAQERQSA